MHTRHYVHNAHGGSKQTKLKKPMILEVNNKGAKDMTHNWSVKGPTRNVNVREWFLRDLKEEGIIEVKWIARDNNSADLFTKNLQGPLFEKHTKMYCGPLFEKHTKMYYGNDEYMRDESKKRQQQCGPVHQ
jgi:hypothetical protein